MDVLLDEVLPTLVRQHGRKRCEAFVASYYLSLVEVNDGNLFFWEFQEGETCWVVW